MVRVLERLDEVDFPLAQTCCGQIHFNSGYQQEALPLRRHFVRAFGDADVVVSPSASCVATTWWTFRSGGGGTGVEMDLEKDIKRGRRSGAVDRPTLGQLTLFDGLPADVLIPLAQATRWHLYRRHDEITGPGREEHVVIIAEGMARCYGSTVSQELTWFLLHRRDVVDLTGLSPDLGDMTHVEAVTDRTLAYQMRRDAFRNLVHTRVSVAERRSDQMRADLSQVSELVAGAAGQNNFAGFAHFLGRRASAAPDGIVPYSQAQLGAWSGMSRPEANRFIRDLQRRGLVSHEWCGREVQVFDPQRPIDL